MTEEVEHWVQAKVLKKKKDSTLTMLSYSQLQQTQLSDIVLFWTLFRDFMLVAWNWQDGSIYTREIGKLYKSGLF
jgi:hypothetical protein